MIFPIVRLYETEQQARAAASKLEERGFPKANIFVVTPGATGEGAASTAIIVGQHLGQNAGVYAERVRSGRSLVVARALFGTSRLTGEIMDSCGPVDKDLKLEWDPASQWGPAAPLSEALNLPVLKRDDPSPLSDFLGIPVLSRGLSFLSRIFAPLTSSHFFLLGEPTLSRDPAPFSSKLGLPLLARNPAPLSSKLGLPLLTNSPAPLSAMLGLPLLAKSPAPLSAMLGLPLLTRR
jgi:hypothetical protein